MCCAHHHSLIHSAARPTPCVSPSALATCCDDCYSRTHGVLTLPHHPIHLCTSLLRVALAVMSMYSISLWRSSVPQCGCSVTYSKLVEHPPGGDDRERVWRYTTSRALNVWVTLSEVETQVLNALLSSARHSMLHSSAHAHAINGYMH